ncbi:MAG TPA: FAD-dependent oxidoreductase [Hellea balneolensis]|uniref:FAD-dependent oxidoreductase n=1 Tax=Hellea balneolensis TaxID=287478 RepID=A0A7C5LUB4_9PROT|nr:FAD-dependent oxidoreductase [Hellea balneolensis]
MNTDYIVIGAGLIGLSTAYALLERGAGSVRILERRAGAALETSFANAGMVHASLADPWNGPGVGRQLIGSVFDPASPMKLRLASLPGLSFWGLKFLKYSAPERHWNATKHNYFLADHSMQKLAQWRDKLDIKDGYSLPGMMKIFRSLPEYENAKSVVENLVGLGLEARYLSGKEAIEREPYLAPIAHKIKKAIYFPNDYKANAYEFCQGLALAIEKLGGHIEYEKTIQHIIHRDSKIIGVKTNTGDYFAKTTIVAAGPWSYQLLAPLGVGLSMRPVKGYSLTFDGVTGPQIPVGDKSLHAAVTPLGNSVRIAGTAEFTGFNRALKQSRIAPLLSMLEQIYPDLAEGLSIEDGKWWCGFRPVSADGVPFIGMVKPGLAVNAGQGHMGWTLSAGSGDVLASILCGEKPAINMEPFSPNRK